jgi:tetratricopeptide (TPR) repeat protein
VRPLYVVVVATLLCACSATKHGPLGVVVLADAALGDQPEAIAGQRVGELLKQAQPTSGVPFALRYVTTVSLDAQPDGWLERWRTVALDLLPAHEADILVVYLAPGRPRLDGLPFDNLVIVPADARNPASYLLTPFGLSPAADLQAPGAKEWLAAMTKFPLKGGLADWTPQKSAFLDTLPPYAGATNKVAGLELAAKALLTSGNARAAAEVYANAAAADPNPRRLLLERVTALRSDPALLEEAAKLAESMSAQSPQDAEIAAELAITYSRAGKREQAEQTVRAAIARVPVSSALQSALGVLIVEQLGRRTEGMAALRKAVALDPQNEVSKQNLASASAMETRIREELGRLRATAKTSTKVGDWVAYGIAAARLGDLAQAQTALERAQALAPDDPEIGKRLATIRTLRKR